MKNPFRISALPVLLIVGLLLPPTLQSAGLEDWTLEDVLAKILEANGGEDGVMAVTNVRFIGEIKGASNAFDFVLLKKRPNKMRIHLNMYKRSIENGFDGQNGWRRYTVDDRTKVVDIEGEELFLLRVQADFDGPLVGASFKGTTRRLVGVERIDRVDYFLVAVDSEMDTTLHYIDSRTFRELKAIKKSSSPDGEPVEVTSFFYDVQRHAQIWIAHRVERHLPDGSVETILIEDVEINPGILDMAFARPEERN
jgi:hypothetical protein